MKVKLCLKFWNNIEKNVERSQYLRPSRKSKGGRRVGAKVPFSIENSLRFLHPLLTTWRSLILAPLYIILIILPKFLYTTEYSSELYAGLLHILYANTQELMDFNKNTLFIEMFAFGEVFLKVVNCLGRLACSSLKKWGYIF